MPAYASAKLREDGIPVQFATGGLAVKPGDAVVISTEKGERLGTVVPDVPASCGSCTGCAVKPSPPRMLRFATEEDRSAHERLVRREGDSYRRCILKIKERELPMKLVRVELEGGGSRTTFFFTAEERIDFRGLVRELARELQTRIEMRQVGPRDAAGMLGGYGSCGRPLCCSTFLTRFRSISIKMAKKQNLSLNPSKLTGQCGRLKCCLAYEYEPG